MNENAEQQQPVTASPSYVRGQLAKAFATALTHEDAATRLRAEDRGRRWRAVLSGMADGRLRIGSRAPVAGLPAWVTLDVVRGGFATGNPSAGGPLLPYETEAARRAGVPANRAALFAHCLTESGLAGLWELLDSGRYEVAVPEEAALLTVAWLVRAEQMQAAVELVEELHPFADRLRFTPRPSLSPPPDVMAVHRRTVAEAAETLARRGPNRAVETQREALTVWQPFSDELLAHWLEAAGPDGTFDRAPGSDWHARGEALLHRYRVLAAKHVLCGKHRNPRENLGLLRVALEETVAGCPLDARRLGLLRHAVTSMVRKRGLPGSGRHTALRREQARQAALPSHQAMAQVVSGRLSVLPQDVGTAHVSPLVAPVTAQEHRETGVPAGAAVPPAIRQVVEAALSAPIGTLVERGVVPSAEVLAELVPQLVAATTAQSYRDEPLRTLMASNYRAFRNRRSLLLLNLQRQVRVDELPWVRATAAHQEGGTAAEEAALTALRRLAGLSVQAFPATVLPNPLVRELGVLARQADVRAPLVEELAADIFLGTFSPKFLHAARDAAELLRGTLYERYYGIDYAAVRNMAITEIGESLSRSYGARTSPGFARLCTERAGGGSFSVAANGKIIEQSQILTTHNLATLVHRVGVAPDAGWDELTLRCFASVCRLTARVHNNPRPLGTIKDAAYAWRQMLFYLSLCAADRQSRVLGQLEEDVARHPGHVAARLGPALAGLRLTAAGGHFSADGAADAGRARRFLGWATDGHWMRPDPGAAPGRR
jgi:hypothetical protein